MGVSLLPVLPTLPRRLKTGQQAHDKGIFKEFPNSRLDRKFFVRFHFNENVEKIPNWYLKKMSFPYLVEKLSDISTPFSANPWRLSSWCIAIPRQCDVSWRTYPCAPGSGDSPALRDSGSLLLLRGGRLFRSPQYLPHRPDNTYGIRYQLKR